MPADVATANGHEGTTEDAKDARFEFDAPRFYNFAEGSPENSPPDRWFDTTAPQGLCTPPEADHPRDSSDAKSSANGTKKKLHVKTTDEAPLSPDASPRLDGGQPPPITDDGARAKRTPRAAKPAKVTEARLTPSAPASTPARGRAAAGSKGAVTPARLEPAADELASAPAGGKTAAEGGGRSRPALAAITNTRASAAGEQAGHASRPANARVTRSASKLPQAKAAASPPVRTAGGRENDPSGRSTGGHEGRGNSAGAGEKAVSGPAKGTVAAVERARCGAQAGVATNEGSPAGRNAAATRQPIRDRAVALTVRASARPRAAAEPSGTSAAAAAPTANDEARAKRPRLHGMKTRSLPVALAPSAPPASPWRSMAEKVAEFEGRETWAAAAAAAHEARAAAAGRGCGGSETSGQGQLTRPRSPSFATRGRARPARFKPREEEEAEAIAALPPFRARPFNRMLFEGQARGVGPAPRKSTTKPEPFDLRTDRRAAPR